MTAKKTAEKTDLIPVEDSKEESKETTSENPMVSKEAALALRTVAIEEHGKREDSMNEFLAQLPKSVAADVRKETKAFLGDLRAAAGKLTTAIVHLWEIKKRFTEMEDSDPEALFSSYGRALVHEGYVTSGTLYTFSKKIEVFETLQLAEPARAAIMAYSSGDAVIVRRPLTPEEIKAHKAAHPSTKAPKGVYEPSKYFQRAVEVVEVPAKWTPESSDSYAGSVVRLAAKLRGKDRSGKDNDGVKGDDRKVQRFEDAVDRLEVFIKGESTDSGVKGMIVLADKSREADMLVECGETIVEALCTRLPLANLEGLHEDIETMFTRAIERATKKAAKAA